MFFKKKAEEKKVKSKPKKEVEVPIKIDISEPIVQTIQIATTEAKTIVKCDRCSNAMVEVKVGSYHCDNCGKNITFM